MDSIYPLNVILKQWVEAQVRAEAGKIIRVGEANVIPVLNNHVPAHKPHLKTKNGPVLPVIGQDKFQRIAISHPNEPLTEGHVATFVNCVIA